MNNTFTLSELGWKPFFQQQLSLDEFEVTKAARVFAHHRSRIEMQTEAGLCTLALSANMPSLTVGDWVLLNDKGAFIRLLDRNSLFARKAPGSDISAQLIAANIDTVFIVSSMNDSFNLNRIERYLALANEAGVTPVVVLSKSDLCDDPFVYIEQARSLGSMIMVEVVNALDESSVKPLLGFCQSGDTIAFLGSSGVGKSTLINTLIGNEVQETGGIREDDSKGRHTTTGREIFKAASGALLMDTPGMRELQLTACEEGVAETFDEITQLAKLCKFGDCKHQGEPQCAVQDAIVKGELEERRLVSYLKLLREQALNSASLAQRRKDDKQLTRYYRSTQSEARRFKKNEP